MLLKGMDRERAQLFLQQSIAQMCKVTVSFTGPIEIDGIICITGRDKDDLVLVKLHEKLISPAVSDLDVLDTHNQDGESSSTPDLCHESLNVDGEIEDNFKTENNSCETDDVVGNMTRRDCANVQENIRTNAAEEESDSCSISYNIRDMKVEPVLLDSDCEDGVNLDTADNSETSESVDLVSHIKRKMLPDFDPIESYSKLIRIDNVDESSYPVMSTTGTDRLSASQTNKGETPMNTGGQSGTLSCNRCQEGFSDFAMLREHTKCMHQLYICEQCQQLFTHISSLHRHMQLHCDTVNWLCTICQHKFKRKEHLSHHIACHFDMQLHQCGQCNKGFKVRSRLQVHLERQHRSKAQHMCKPCFMEFTDAATFTEHQRHHEDFSVKYMCEQCGFLGVDRLSLINHSIIHFGLRIDTSEQQQQQQQQQQGP